MTLLGRMIDHIWLVKRMARAINLDMVTAYDEGSLSQEDWAEIVRTCQGCTWAPRCDAWLDKNGGRDCAPKTCLNRARFEELRRRQAQAVS